MLMMAEDLLGVILLEETLDIIHSVSNAITSMLSLRDVLLHYLKMSDGHSMIEEVHQEGILTPPTIIIPITAEDEHMAVMMNKNLPAFLWHMLRELGMPTDFMKDLLGKSCEASLVAKVYKCTRDEKTRTLTTKEEEEKSKLVKAFESTAWFKDTFGILGKKDQAKKNAPPKELFNLNGNESYKTIHDHHESPNEPVEIRKSLK
jgi:hypothetical protein